MRYLASVAAILALSVAAIGLISIASPPEGIEGQSVWDKWLYAYRLVIELSRSGINVSEHLELLNQSLHYIEIGDYDKASRILDQVIPELENDYIALGSYAFQENVRKYSIVAALLSLPPLFYYLFPRAYLEVWYRLKRNWIVVSRDEPGQ